MSLVKQTGMRRDELIRQGATAAVVASSELPARAARFILLLGLLLAVVASTPKTVAEASSVGLLEGVRGLGPVVGYFASLLCYRASWSPRSVVSKVGILFGVMGLASCLWSVDAQSTFLKVIPLLFTYLSAARLGRLYSSPTEAAASMTRISVYVTFSAVLQYFLFHNVAFVPDSEDGVARLRSLIPDAAPNILALVALVAIIGTILGRWNAAPAKVITNLAAIFSAAFVLIATYSRIIMVLAVVCAFVALLYSVRAKPVGVSAALIVGAGFLYTLLALYGQNLSGAASEYLARGQTDANLGTLTGRTVIWERALDFWARQPLLGYGYYSGHRFGLPQWDALFQLYSNLDSTWIETLVDLGILGTIVLGAYAALAICQLLVHAFRSRDILPLMMISAIVAVSFVNPTLQTPTLSLIFFSVVASAPRRGIRHSAFDAGNSDHNAKPRKQH